MPISLDAKCKSPSITNTHFASYQIPFSHDTICFLDTKCWFRWYQVLISSVPSTHVVDTKCSFPWYLTVISSMPSTNCIDTKCSFPWYHMFISLIPCIHLLDTGSPGMIFLFFFQDAPGLMWGKVFDQEKDGLMTKYQILFFSRWWGLMVNDWEKD